jgi:hypothetical protein
MCRCGVGRDVADVSNDYSGFPLSTLNMAAVGSFETSASTAPPTQHLRRLNLVPNYTHLDGLGFLSLHSRCAFHLQTRNLRGKCYLAERCAGFVATVCPSQTRTHRLQRNCGVACWLVCTTGSILAVVHLTLRPQPFARHTHHIYKLNTINTPDCACAL